MATDKKILSSKSGATQYVLEEGVGYVVDKDGEYIYNADGSRRRHAGRLTAAKGRSMTIRELRSALSRGDRKALNTLLDVMDCDNDTTKKSAASTWLNHSLEVRKILRAQEKEDKLDKAGVDPVDSSEEEDEDTNVIIKLHRG